MVNKEKNFISAVIYIHNAENRIENFLKTIISVLEENFEHSEIICVNDFSNDNSVLSIKNASSIAKTTSVSLLNMGYMHGLEDAMNAGIDLAIGDFVLEFDNTILDFDKDEVIGVYRRALSGYDIVSASPEKKEKFTSKLFYTFLNVFMERSYNMTTESFRILSRRVINRTRSMNKTIPYRKVIYANCGLKTDNIKYKVVNKAARDAKDIKEKKYMRRLAVDSLILFTDLGYKFSVTMTFIMMSISVVMAAYSLFTYLFAYPIRGWTTTLLFLSVAFFGLFGILTAIVKYLQLLVNLVFKRKHYVFESMEKLTN